MKYLIHFFELLIFFDSEIICDNATEVFKSFESAKLNSSNFLESSFFSLVIGIKFFASFILLRALKNYLLFFRHKAMVFCNVKKVSTFLANRHQKFGWHL